MAFVRMKPCMLNVSVLVALYSWNMKKSQLPVYNSGLVLVDAVVGNVIVPERRCKKIFPQGNAAQDAGIVFLFFPGCVVGTVCDPCGVVLVGYIS